MFALLLRRKVRSLANALREGTPWDWARNTAFILAGLGMLCGLYAGFLRLLRALGAVEIIGPLLVWKLTAMALMTTFSMAALSSLIISLTTFFHSDDLPFLLKSPVPATAVFADKSIEAAFFSSWMIGLVLFPYVLALGTVQRVGWPFYAAFFALTAPFLVLATVIGMAFTLALMRLFPSPRTRDIIWVLSSVSVALVYVLLRFSEPERLVRPDALRLVAEYLGYLQAPTAPYLPSWWLTQAMAGWVNGRWSLFARHAAGLAGAAALAYAALLALASRTYARSYSGAQEGARSGRGISLEPAWERRLKPGMVATLYWRERKCFFRDVAHWSQLVLILALMCVYLFSIRRLPLDSPDLKSLVCFINLGIAGFVLSSLGLRFTFPSVSLEGRSFWVVRAAPLAVSTLLREKFLFSLIPMTALSSALILVSNHFLEADRFISWLSFGTILVMTWTLCAMGVGFGAVFPKFNIPDIHQIESSAGGFVYMAACLFYVGLTVAVEAPVVQMHFHSRFGRPDAWQPGLAAACAAALLAVNALAAGLPWRLGRRALERHEQ